MKKSGDPSLWNEQDWAYHNKNISDWSDIEWRNVFALYKASELYELNDPLSYEKFNKKMRSDKNFASNNRLKPGMDSEEYNPWS